MNNLQKRLALVGAALALQIFPVLSTAAYAYYPFVRPLFQISQSKEIPQLKYYRLDTSNCKDCVDWLNKQSARPATLSNEEFEQMKSVLQKSITRHNLKNQGNNNFQISGHYGVQYLPYIDKEGKKQIWINGFCVNDELYQKPKTEIIEAFDGGSCFFNALIRSGTKKSVPISIHGFA